MIFSADCQALVGRVGARPAGHRPGFEHAIDLQPEIPMQPRRRVLLDDETAAAAFVGLGASLWLARRFTGFGEIALAIVFGQQVSGGGFFAHGSGPLALARSRWLAARGPGRGRAFRRISLRISADGFLQRGH